MTIKIKRGKYKVYHILGQKVGCTTNIQKRVIDEQGFKEDEFEILFETNNIKEASIAERTLQKDLGYKVDLKPYDKLFNNTKKDINVTDQTTTFPISIQEIDAEFLIDLKWKTQYGNVNVDSTDKVEWILENIKKSMFNDNRSYIYNKALYEASVFHKLEIDINEKAYISDQSIFDNIRKWGHEKGILSKGNVKTQLIKLYEETGELSEAVLKEDQLEIIDAIGDIVIVLTNLAELTGNNIETCIQSAYDEVANRKGIMTNGTFVKNER